MKRTLALALLVIVPAFAESKKHKAFRVSVAIVSIVKLGDAASSFGLQERNPIVGRGPFGAAAMARDLGIFNGLLLLEHFAIRRHPQTEAPITVGNYIAAGLFSTATIHNLSIR